MQGQMYTSPFNGSNWLDTYEADVLQVIEYAEIWSGLSAFQPSGSATLLLGDIPVVDGSITIDRSNVIRRNCTNIRFTPDVAGDMLPLINSLSGYLSPIGNELRVYRGAITPTGNVYAQLGCFMISGVDVKEDENGLLLVGTLKDRGQWIARQGFRTPYATDGTSAVGDAITDVLLSGAYIDIGVTFNVIGPAWTVGSNPCHYVPSVATYRIGDDPWKAVTDLASSAGLALYFDYAGNLVLDYVPTPSYLSSCVSYLENTSSALTTIDRGISNDQVPNVVCVTSSGSSVTAPLQAWWWDSDASSPTYYAPAPAGGWVPTNHISALATQSASATYPYMIQSYDSTLIGPTYQATQAQAVAIAIGMTAIGTLEKETFTIRDQPAHDVDDVFVATRAVAGITAATNFIVDSVTIDLAADTDLQLTARPVLT